MAMYLNGVNLSFSSPSDGSSGGGKTAYDYALEHGFTGSEAQFGDALANLLNTQMLFGRFNRQMTWNDDNTVYTETWSFNNDNYSQIITETVSGTTWTKQLKINNVNAGLWTITYDNVNKTCSSVYTAQ